MTKKFTKLNNPLLRHKLGILRDKTTSTFEFRETIKSISLILAYEAMQDWDQFKIQYIETPIAKTQTEYIENGPIAISILRAGNPVQEAVLSMLPFATGGHIGLYRNEKLDIVEYFFKIPENHQGKTIFLCEPLLATANTSIHAISLLKKMNVGKIKILCLLVSQTGLDKLHAIHPDVEIFALNVETEMNDHGYLVPGLGDAGDRIYGTK